MKEIFSMMMINKQKVWTCLSTWTNGMTTGYFSSIVPAIRDHLATFVLCPAAQVYWWLRRRGCLTEDVNRLIRHCFTLSQQQRVMKSKYLKDLGHAVINQLDADNIINAATTQGIYNLTLRLSDKERWTMVSGRAHNASAITFGEAKEESMEAYNFSLVQLVTSTHSVDEKKKDARSVASGKSLAKLVFSIGTTTSKVTKVDNMDDSEGTDSSNGKEEGSKKDGKTIAIEGMGILMREGGKPKATKTRTEDDNVIKGTGSQDNKAEDKEDKYQDNKEMAKAGADITKRMAEASGDLIDTSEEGTYNTPQDPLTDDDKGETYKERDSSVKLGEDDLSTSTYASDAVEVESGEFKAAHAQKYKEPLNFRQALWNEAGPSIGSMKIMLEMLRTEFKGELEGLKADLTNYPQRFINFLIKEAGEDLNAAIAFLDLTLDQISQYKEDDHNKKTYNRDADKDANALPPDKEGKQIEASKTQGMVPRAPEATPAEGTTTSTVNMTEEDREGLQSVSMAPGG